MRIIGLDHLVLTVRDVAASSEFYARALGAEVLSSADGRKAVRLGAHKINLHPVGAEFEPKALSPRPGSGDFCLLVAEPMAEVTARLAEAGVEVVAGPVPRQGAAGRLISVYFRDPDGNLVELARIEPQAP